MNGKKPRFYFAGRGVEICLLAKYHLKIQKIGFYSEDLNDFFVPVGYFDNLFAEIVFKEKFHKRKINGLALRRTAKGNHKNHITFFYAA